MTLHQPTAAQIAGRFPTARRKGKTYAIPAVCHGSDDNNLNIWQGSGGIGLSCKSRGCDYSTIMRALGMQPARRSQSETLIATYQHIDGTARDVHRLDASPGDCTRRGCNQVSVQHKHLWGKGSPKGCFLLLWNDKSDGAPIIVTEGEKAAASLARRGFTAASYKGGAGAVALAIYTPVKNRDVIIWPDADDEGAKAGVKAGEMCEAAGASSVQFVIPPADAVKGWDGADASNADVEWMLAEAHATPDALISAFPDAFKVDTDDGDDADDTPPDAATALADYGRTGNLLTEFGNAGRTEQHCNAWLLQSSSGIIAAYEKSPPSGQAQGGMFYAALPCGRISPNDDALAPHFQQAANDFIGATAASGAKGMHDTIRFIQERMLCNDGMKKLRKNLALTIGNLKASGAMPKDAHVVDHAEIDADTRYLGVANGVVDLTNGELITDGVERGIYISRSTGVRYIPGAQHAAVDDLLLHPTTPAAHIDFLLDCAGHALHRTPDTTARIYVLLETKGRSGKSVLLAAIQGALGDYGASLQSDALQANKRQPGAQSGFIFPLTKAAFVTTAEISGMPLGAEQIKMLTGEASIPFRMLYQDAVERRIHATIFASANSVPSFKLDDSAMLERYTPIPFQRIPADMRDLTLPRRLEEPGAREALLALLIDRAVANQAPPALLPEIERAKREHRALLIGDDGLFLDDCVEKGNDNDRLSTAAVWHAWCEYNSLPPDTPANLSVGGKTKTALSRRVASRIGAAAVSVRIEGKVQKAWKGWRLRFQSD